MSRLKFWKRILLTPEEKKERNKRRLLTTISGLLLGLAFPPIPFPFTLLIFVALIPYFFAIEKIEKLAELNRFTYLMAFVFCVITIYWVGSWSAEADPFLMIGGVLLLFFNPIFFLIPSTLFYFAKQFFNRKAALYLFPFFWVTYEYAYMLTDASFPWLTLANGLTYFNSFIQIADVIGALGISFLVLAINLFLYLAIKEFIKRRKQLDYSNKTLVSTLALVLLLLLFPLLYGFSIKSNFQLPKKKIKVGLIQPNLNPWDKWKGGNLWDVAKIYLDLSEKAAKQKTELIIWPETAFPVYLLDGTNEAEVDSIYKFVSKHKVYLLTGMPDFKTYFNKKDAPYDAKHSKKTDLYYTTYNGILLFSPHTKLIQRYGKMKLVPFGEHVPFADVLPFLGDLIKWEVGLSGWNKGRDTTVFNIIPNNSKDTAKVNALVCFESVYPDFVAQFAQRGANMISVVTNDSWYGNSSGPYQHKEISVLRAIENRRTVVRAANGGISTIIDPLGNTIVSTKMYTTDFIVGDVWLEDEKTFFSKNPLIVPVISYVISLFVIGLFFLNKLKKLLKI